MKVSSAADGLFSRQSFLGRNSERIFADCRTAIIGLGGGGSHVAQQLAHIGVGNFVLVDPDVMKSPNLNRTVGARRLDKWLRSRKVKVARRLIRGINPAARVQAIAQRWEDVGRVLRGVDVIFGCVDGYRPRSDLEGMARRYLIPYIDIGMDVHQLPDQYAIGGQVIVSVPGQACMRCMRFLSEEKLAQEASRYGDAGPRPQVIWPNGVLASIAVGAFVKLFTPWCVESQGSAYLEYEGNAQVVQSSNRLLGVDMGQCPHYSLADVGDPFWARMN